MRPGDVIAGRFQILGAVRGGLSLVFQALDRRTSETVALKIISLSGGGPDLVKRIEREIQIYATLSHPHVVRCLGSGLLPEGRPYLVLEWLEGKNLAEFKRLGPMSMQRVLELGTQVAGALAAAHAVGIVHRDIKPENIFLLAPEVGAPLRCRVIDFGVAKLREAVAITVAGAIVGTPYYMAPEQGGLATSVDGRADLFSLGVVAFELLTGRLPWPATSELARLARIQDERAMKVRSVAPEVPVALAELIDGLLALDPAERPASAEEVAARFSALEAELGEELISEPAFLPTRGMSSEGTPEISMSALISVHSAPAIPLVTARPVPTPKPRIQSRPRPKPDRKGATISEPGRAPRGRSASRARKVSARRMSTVMIRGPGPDSETVPVAIDTGPTPAPNDPFLEGVMPHDESASQALTHDFDPAFGEVGDTARIGHAQIREEAEIQRVLYGRVQELESLRGIATRLLETVAAGFVLVVGPAGIGKTRVCLELGRILLTTSDPPAILLGRCDEQRRFSPYGFLRTALLAEAGIRPDDAPEIQRGKLLRLVPSASRLQALLGSCEPPLPGAPYEGEEPQGTLWFSRAGLGGAPPEPIAEMVAAGIPAEYREGDPIDEPRAGLVAYLARVLRIPFPKLAVITAAERAPRRMGEQVRRALDVVLRGVAELRRLIFLVDDAHWLDADSATVLADLVRPARGSQVVVVAFSLPQLLDGPDVSSPLDGRRARVFELPLLDSRAAREMVRGLVPGPIESNALEGLVKRAAGNPLFLQQLVLSARENGALALSASGEYELCKLAGDGSDDDLVPPTVSTAVASRIGHMDASVVAALTAAAVLGEVFSSEGVASLAGLPPHVATSALNTLVEGGFVRRRRLGGVRGRVELEFTHGVIRSLALSRLKRKKRHKLERAAVDHLDALGESDHALLAFHLAYAGLHERAATEFAEAAASALGLGAAGSALALAEEGVLLTDRGATEDGTRHRLLILAERAAALVGDADAVERSLAALERMAERDVEIAHVLERRASLAARSRRDSQAASEAKAAIEIYRKVGDKEAEARVLVAYGEAAARRRRARAALRSFLAAQAMLAMKGSSSELARALLGLGHLALDSGDYRTAQLRFREALGHASAASHPESAFGAALGLVTVARLTGDVPRAHRRFELAAPFADTVERRLVLEIGRASVLAEERRTEEAEATLVRVLSVLREHPELAHERRLAILFLGRSWVYEPAMWVKESESRLVEIRERLESALEEASSVDLALVPALELVLGALYAREQRFDLASRLVLRAYERFRAEGSMPEEEPPRVTWVRANVLAAMGKPRSDVLAAYGDAVEQLDLTAARLDRKARKRYLERELAQRILSDAEAAGLLVVRDASSHRVSPARP